MAEPKPINSRQFTLWMKETGPGQGCWKELLLTLHFKGMPRSNLNDQISIFQFFDCHPGFYLWALILSICLKRKTWPQEDCYWESVFANGRSHICSKEPEVCILLSRERTDFGSWATVKTRPERLCLEPGSEPHSRLLTKCHSHIPRKTNMNGIKTPREGGFE